MNTNFQVYYKTNQEKFDAIDMDIKWPPKIFYINGEIWHHHKSSGIRCIKLSRPKCKTFHDN